MTVAELEATRRARLEQMSAARRVIERRGLELDCSRLPAIDSAGAANWAQAWCNWSSRNWSMVATTASLALPHFEAGGDLRRQIELQLMTAVARHAQQHDAHAALERAEVLFNAASAPLYSDHNDRFGGDLPYLIADARIQGLTLRMSEGRENALDPARLLELAHREYARSLPEARPHVSRSQARLALDRGALDEASQAISQAIALEQDAGNRDGLRESLKLFAELARELGDLEAAHAVDRWLYEQQGAEAFEQLVDLPLPRRAEQLAAQLRRHASREALLAKVRHIRLEPNRVVRPPQGLLRAASTIGDRDLARLGGQGWRLLYELGALLDEQGLDDQARRYYAHAVRQIEQTRRAIADPGQRQRFFRDKRHVYLALVAQHVDVDTRTRPQSSYRRAFDVAGALKARGLIDLWLGASSAPAWQRPLGDGIQALELAERANARLRGWFKGRDRGPEVHTVLSDVARRAQRQLGPKQAIVEYVLGRKQGYVWVIAADGVIMRRVPGRDLLAPKLEAFRQTLVQPWLKGRSAKRHRDLAEQLYRDLLGPLSARLARYEHLVVAPDGPLYDLPFEALARPAPRSAPIDYMLRHATVSYVPSAAVWLAQPRAESGAQSGTKTSAEALLLGAPLLEQRALKLLAISQQMPQRGMLPLATIFPELPGSARELQDVARQLRKRRYDVALHRGASATEALLRRRGAKPLKLLHIASHGLSDAPHWMRLYDQPSNVQQPTLLLAEGEGQLDDGLLTLSEILSYGTRAELVVLSGCTTGRGWLTLGEGAFGLAGAFLKTGSRAVIASTWSISDLDTARLMRRFYRELAHHAPARALREAKLAMLALKGRRSPFFWAAFRLVGIDR